MFSTASLLSPELGVVRRILGLAVVGVIVTLVTYLTTTFTTWGQAIVDEAWLARVAEGRGFLKVSRYVLEFIDVGTVVGVIAILLVVTAVRRNWHVGAVLAGGLVGAAASAEILKAVLPRPDLAPQLEAMMGEHAANSFPSGHVTIVTASIVALLVVAPAVGRLPLALLGAIVVASVACAVVAAGWHRPSDALGGLGWGLAWQGLVVSWVVKDSGVSVAERVPSRGFWLTSAGLMVAAIAVMLAVLGNEQVSQLATSVSAWAFARAEMVLAAAAVLTICTTGWILRQVEVR